VTPVVDEARPRILEVSAEQLPGGTRWTRRFDMGFVHAILQRAGSGRYLCDGRVYADYFEFTRTREQIRDWFVRNHPDLRLRFRTERLAGGWRFWVSAEPRLLEE
jgi:hypothetical protein